MAAPSVTYTFSASTTAASAQVNQNFTDIINGLSDGTKDLTISALTVGGNFTLNGSITTIGNATSDDLVITGSLASSIPIKTTFSYDIGSSTLGLRDIYLGDAGSAARTTKIRGATVASSYTITTPTTAGSQYDVLENDGSAVLNFRGQRLDSVAKRNYSLSPAVAANALTITLNAGGGSAPSSTDPIEIVFRNATAATGTPSTVRITSALTTTISSGSTAGHASAVAHYLYVYAINNGGTAELAWSSSFFDEGTIVTTVAEGAAGAADSNASMYSTTARTGVALRLLGRLKTTQATAGTWATAIAETSIGVFNNQIVSARYTTVAGQSIANTGGPYIVDFGTKAWDTHNCVTVGASWKFTAPVAGKYQLNTAIQFTAGVYVAGNTAGTYLYKSGTLAPFTYVTAWGASNYGACMVLSDIVNMAVGDYVDVRVDNFRTAGATTLSNGDANRNWVSIALIGYL